MEGHEERGRSSGPSAFIWPTPCSSTAMFYDLEHMIVLGRVTSGKGGDLLIAECNRVLAAEYPELAEKMSVMLPDEKARRVGQSIAAASLPEV